MSTSSTSDSDAFATTRRRLLSATTAAAVAVAAVGSAAAQAPASPAPAGRSQSRQSRGGVWKHDEVALLLIDYQPEMFRQIRSETSAALIELNTRFLIRAARALDVPVILSTVAVEMGINEPTVAAIAAELPGSRVIDRSSMNAWEDKPFHDAVLATGRKRLVFGALYTEICLAFPVIDALKEGFDSMYIVDAVGGMSQIAHATAIDRMAHAGAIPNTALAWVTELFRDWKSAEAPKVRPIIVWYLQQLEELRAAK